MVFDTLQYSSKLPIYNTSGDSKSLPVCQLWLKQCNFLLVMSVLQMGLCCLYLTFSCPYISGIYRMMVPDPIII